MATDYASLKKENEQRYGTDIGRYGPKLLADRYDDRTHFIFELLQNAEDALRRTKGVNVSRSVQFKLYRSSLSFSHYGHPFTEKDVRSICNICESSKLEGLNIGRFGIGFKSVYAFTDTPEIYSGDEHFAIDSYVKPRALEPFPVPSGATFFQLPFKTSDSKTKDIPPYDAIANFFQKIDNRTLLFLKEIEEIEWSIENGFSGKLLRQTEQIEEGLCKVTIVEQIDKDESKEENWLIFSEPIPSGPNEFAGYVEIAFKLIDDDRNNVIERVSNSKLIVFFPTIVDANLGFLIQGPYHTTLNRDNIVRHDAWNQKLINLTSNLLIKSLHTLKNKDLLSIEVLQCLPLNVNKFRDDPLFSPLFEAVKSALKTQDFIPSYQSGHICGNKARLGRTKEIRELFSPKQLGELLGTGAKVFWLDGEITRDRTPELRDYLVKELGISKVDMLTLISKIDEKFLANQNDEWMIKFYASLTHYSFWQFNGKLQNKAIIRLEEGKHVAPFLNNTPQAFLPSSFSTEFPTVKKSICENTKALKFLKELGLTEPDPVDDVIQNVLPNFNDDSLLENLSKYEKYIERLSKAFATDSQRQCRKLIEALSKTSFIAAVDAGSQIKKLTKPNEVYQANQRLKSLFQDIPGILFVDDSISCLRGDAIKDLFKACGVSECLRPEKHSFQPYKPPFTWDVLSEMRRKAGWATSTGNDQIEDIVLRGLDDFFKKFSSFSMEEKKLRSKLLWESLCDVENYHGKEIFEGAYKWFYVSFRSCSFEANFLKQLRQYKWIPNENGEFKSPENVIFENIDPPWQDNPFLRSKISFMPAAIEELAKKGGYELGVLELIKVHGITEVKLKSMLGIKGVQENLELDKKLKSTPDVKSIKPATDEESLPIVQNQKNTPSGEKNSRNHSDRERQIGAPVIVSENLEDINEGLSHEERMELEDAAIRFIISSEKKLERTPVNNPGFDLVEKDSNGNAIKYVEVKSKKSAWNGAIIVSPTQFKKAQEEGSKYWLYVVEFADNENQRKLYQIQNPAGKAQSFQFCPEWKNMV